jgi:hypothetical protein
MKASTVSTLKKELNALPNGDVVDICLRLVKYKKENKELLSYLLFDANNEAEYIRSVKEEIDLHFAEINFSQLYFAKKSIRKILKITTKYIKYSNHKQTEVELLIHFCTKLKKSGIRIASSNSINNLYNNQLRKINLAVGSLHEDLQHDYREEVEQLT